MVFTSSVSLTDATTLQLTGFRGPTLGIVQNQRNFTLQYNISAITGLVGARAVRDGAVDGQGRGRHLHKNGVIECVLHNSTSALDMEDPLVGRDHYDASLWWLHG